MLDEEYHRQLSQRARLTCARIAQGDSDALRDVLDALALWPGQEHTRRSSLQVRNFNGKNKPAARGSSTDQLSFFR